MEKFTKAIKKQNNEIQDKDIVYQNNDITIKSKDDFIYVDESDKIFVLPYAKDDGYIFLKSEMIIPWNDKYKNQLLEKNTNFLTLLSTTIDNGEDPEKALRRSLYSDAGIAISQFYEFDISEPLFITKNNTSQIYVCFMELNMNEYKIVSSPTKIKNDIQTVRISIADLDDIRINDIVTKLLIDQLKNLYDL
jgi:hypothetical protein